MKTIILIMLTLLSLKVVASTQLKDFGTVKLNQIKTHSPAITPTFELMETEALLTDLNKSECSPKVFKNPLKVVNRRGAAGKWQLTAIARKDAGFRGTLKQFLNSEKIQRTCVLKLIENNKKYIKYCIPNYKDFIGKTIHGVKITYSGMLMAAHLAGVGGLKRFLRSGYNASDGNQSVKSYMKRFQGYQINLIV